MANLETITLPNGNQYNFKMPAMTGASAQEAGASGAVPAPSVGDEDKYLKGDGTWGTPSGGGSDLGLSIINGVMNITYTT